MKLAVKISLSFFAVTVICTVTALSILYSIAKSNLQRTIEASLESAARSRTAHIETYLRMLKISVGQLSKSPTLENLLKVTDKDNLQQSKEFEPAMTRLRRTKEADPSLYEFLLLDKTGKVIASSNEKNIGSDKSTDAYFLGGQKGIFIKDAYYLESINEPLIAVSAPLSDSQTGELLGVLVARVKLNDLWNITTERAGLGETGEIYIVNKYGFMITPSRFLKDTFLKQAVDTEGGRQAFLHKGNGSVPHQELTVYPDYRGAQVLGAHEYIPQMQWGVLAEIDTKEAFAPLAQLRLILLEILFIMALAAWLLSRGIAMLIAGPLNKLHKGTEIIGRGNFDYKVGTDAKDEVGQLSRAFDRMTENLKTTTTSVENLNKEIAARKQAEQNLVQAKADLEKAYQQLQESFELETRLTVQAQADISSSSGVVTHQDGAIQKSEPAAMFDSKSFTDRLSGDSALIREIINIFLDETPKSMRELEKTIKKQQQENAARMAHTIKGSATNVGGNKLHAVALKIENACNSADWREAETLVPQLKKQFESLDLAMHEFLKTVK